jgi:catechol 2,3-dioxygenase-like lactoylglutathione lyase family enzyme
MGDLPAIRFTTVVLDAPDPHELAGFYRRILGWEIGREESGWVILRDPDGGVGLSFQLEPDYVPPTWPSRPDRQQMQIHLDIEVEDMEAAGRLAIEAGAALAEFQPQDEVRVYLDPVGHPFCLFPRV